MLGTFKTNALFITLLVGFSTNVFADDQIQLGIVLNLDRPLKVDYLSKKGSMATTGGAQLGGLLGALVVGGGLVAKNAGYAKRLNATMDKDFNRQEMVESALRNAFKDQNPQIRLTFLSSDAISKKGKLTFKAVNAGANPYVAVINESSGLSYLGAGLGTLTAFSQMKITVYDVGNKKRLFVEKIYQTASHLSQQDINIALDNKGTYAKGYPPAIRQAADAVFWLLNGRDVHHLIAKGTSAEENFPSMIKILEDAVASFRFDRPRRVDRWRLKKESPFEFVAVPRKHQKTFAIRTHVKVLTPELGQDFNSLKDFISYYKSTLTPVGWDVTPIQKVDTLEFKEDWMRYTLADPNIGVSIFLHRMVEGFIVTHQIIVLEEDPKELLTKYKSVTQMYVDESKLYAN